MNNVTTMRQDLDEVIIKVNSLLGSGANAVLPPNITPLSPPSTNFSPIPPVVSPSAVNQLRNGDYSHSVNTWFELIADPTTNAGHECAWWFSNDAPVNGQLLSDVNALTNIVNQTLKYVGHANYDENYSDWERTKGIGRFQGTTTIDAPLPMNVAKPGITEFLGAIGALRDIGYPTARIVVPDDCLMFAGVWDDTAGQLDWLHGTPFSLSATVRGTPATTTQRNYKIYAKTDKGYTFLSTEAVVMAAPSDVAFLDGNCDVLLSWDAIPGILEYDVYRHDITAAKYRILESIGNGANTYADNGSVNIDTDAGGYPSATNTSAIAYAATNPGDLTARLTIDGVAAFWPSIFLNIAIPNTYNQSVTTASQWVRTGLTMALDRQTTDAVATMADATLTSATAAFSATLDVGRDITVADGDGNTLDSSIASVTNSTTIEMADVWPYANATDATIYIVEGGDHGMEVDLVHTSFVSRAAYAPYPDDLNRELQPAATPNGSSQGGPGGGGGTDPGGGGIGCVPWDLPVVTMIGERFKAIPFRDIEKGDGLFSGNLLVNNVWDIQKSRTDNLHIVRTENGIEVPCSPRQPFFRGRTDQAGIAASRLRIGEFVMTVVNGRLERSTVSEIIATGEPCELGTPTLHPLPMYFAGRRYDKTFFHKIKRWVLEWIGNADIVGIALHNRKADQGDLPIE